MPAKLAPLLFGTAAGAGGAAASTAGLFGAAGSFGLTQTLGTLGAVGSALGTLQQGNMQAQMYKDQADQEKIRANEESIQRREALIEALAQQNASTGASGITAVGTPEHIKQTDILRFEEQQSRADKASKIKQNSLHRQAGYAKSGSRLGAGIDLLSYGAKMKSIG